MNTIKLKDLNKGDDFKRVRKTKCGYTRFTYEKSDYCRYSKKYECVVYDVDGFLRCGFRNDIYLSGDMEVIKW